MLRLGLVDEVDLEDEDACPLDVLRRSIEKEDALDPASLGFRTDAAAGVAVVVADGLIKLCTSGTSSSSALDMEKADTGLPVAAYVLLGNARSVTVCLSKSGTWKGGK